MRRRPLLPTLASVSFVAAGLVAACSGSGAGPGDALASFAGAGATLEAVNIQFEPTTITLPAGQPLRLVLDNKDAGVPHDIQVFQGDTVYATSPRVTGPAVTEVRFGPLTPSRYQFRCQVHPAMVGTLVVTP